MQEKSCSICDGPLAPENRSGICATNPRCRAIQKRKSAQEHRYTIGRYSMGRTCSECGSPIKNTNKTGICTKTDQCRKAIIAMSRSKVATENTTWLLEPAFDLDTGEEIVDETTIEVMALGLRRVASTERERTLAAARMIKMGLSPQETAEHIGTVVAKLGAIVAPAGYTVIPRGKRGPRGKQTSKAAVFAKID